MPVVSLVKQRLKGRVVICRLRIPRRQAECQYPGGTDNGQQPGGFIIFHDTTFILLTQDQDARQHDGADNCRNQGRQSGTSDMPE